MRHEDFHFREHGFVGHLAEPDEGGEQAVLVISGGEQSLLPGVKIAERFADFGFVGLSVSLFGAEGLPGAPDRIPLEMFEAAVKYLRKEKRVCSVSAYGQSMGSIFAALAAQLIGGMDNLILVSPTHVPFEGTMANRRTMTGHSVAVWRGQELPFVSADFSRESPTRYRNHPAAGHRVMGMWKAFYDAYMDEAAVDRARLPLEKTGARILVIAGGADEAWPSEFSARAIEKYLDERKYDRAYRVIVYPNVSHLTGMMPNREREKMLYRMIPLIGLMYRSFGRHKRECLAALKDSEREIIAWLGGPVAPGENGRDS
ncbi:MAG: acyl-CoA thioester hydrolase/BAAT C-terminal domain-containing protein [Clostridia bacterium]|nr:acyl-CoA thioester hydrolase/BAAT C-terminal domain-containing protein [Clostridia bacterium]